MMYLSSMDEPIVRILAVEREDDFGLIVTFSDGTCDGYVVEELLNLRPHRPPVTNGVGSRHDEQTESPGTQVAVIGRSGF
jgi:hypothetical protein